MGSYGNAAVCGNGHPASGDTSSWQATNFCENCGDAVLTQCTCGNAIRGRYNADNVISFAPYIPPAYCHACGLPHEWTKRGIEAAMEAARFGEELSDSELQLLRDAALDVTVDTPKTKLASLKIRQLLQKISGPSRKIAQDLFVEIASETAKKLIVG